LPANWQFSDIPGSIGTFLTPLDFIKFEKAFLIISTLELNSFVIPPLPKKLSAVDATSEINTTGMKLVEGINMGFIIDFEQTNADPKMNHLKGILPEPKLLLAAQIDLKNDVVTLEADLKGQVVISGKGSSKLAIGDASLHLCTKPLSMYVGGDIQIPFAVSTGKETLYAIGRLGITDSEVEALMEVSAGLPGPGGKIIPASLDVPLELPGILLDEIGIELGVMWEPAGVDMGLEGQFHIGGEPVGDDKFAVVLDLEGEIPNPTLLYCHIAKFSMEELVTACLDTSIKLPPLINDIDISDFTIYWSESDQFLPDGTVAAQGFGFNGTIDVTDLTPMPD